MRKEEGRRKRGGSEEGKRQEWQKGEREGKEGKRIEEEMKRGSEGGIKGKNGRKGVGGKESVRFDISVCLFYCLDLEQQVSQTKDCMSILGTGIWEWIWAVFD